MKYLLAAALGGLCALGGAAPAALGGTGGTPIAAAIAPLGDTGGAAAAAATTPGHVVSASAASRATASAHIKNVRITSVSCVPASRCSANPHQVSTRGTLMIGGKGISSGMTVAFPSAPGARVTRSSPAGHLHAAGGGLKGLVVTVPKTAHSGHIMVLLSHGRYTSSYGPIYVFAHALHPLKPKDPSPGPGSPGPSAFEGNGMWIWYLSESDGGDLASIIAQAHAAGVTTLFIKSSDGSSNYWSQFSPQLVQTLHANGLKVCAWQYVYGTEPVGEANLGAQAVSDGADCLVIDAESQYEGHYAAAQTYIGDLRAKIGASYPLGLASFPYVYDHTSFPYSVFLGSNGAQFNLPQMYWKDIGNSIDTVYANTYIANRPYGRPVFPLGQTFEGPSAAELVRFREEAVDYGATGLSWWDWQETSATGWSALAAPLAPLTSVTPNPGYAELEEGNKGDTVLWMQEHLASAIASQPTTGVFEATTAANLEQFQSAHGIAPSGHTEAATWQALLALPPISVDWTGGGPEG
ncbi:MAG TPA: peptidoglycan-binding domain-containing protein [Solirubrobacteraceae bacterium]|nr:peptidoglycan-binding domain-containing protein [Solirubrobacteraceae bacterium]